MPTIKLGTQVRQIVKPPIEGVVVGKQYNESTDAFQILVSYPDDDGDGLPQTRWFRDSELEVVEGPVVVTVDPAFTDNWPVGNITTV